MNQKLQEISNKAAADLQAFISESEQKLLEAWAQCEQEAQENETKPKFKFGFSVVLDLDANKMETALTFGVRHKLSRDQQIPDPDQPPLPLDDGTVTISTPGSKPITMTNQQFHNAANKIRSMKP